MKVVAVSDPFAILAALRNGYPWNLRPGHMHLAAEKEGVADIHRECSSSAYTYPSDRVGYSGLPSEALRPNTTPGPGRHTGVGRRI